MILFADYCNQLTIVDKHEVKPYLDYYKVNDIKEYNNKLSLLSRTNPWFYIEINEDVLKNEGLI